MLIAILILTIFIFIQVCLFTIFFVAALIDDIKKSEEKVRALNKDLNENGEKDS